MTSKNSDGIKRLEDIFSGISKSSMGKSSKTWKTNKHLDLIFYKVAKEEGLHPDVIREIYFDGWKQVSDHMRHIELPVIKVNKLGFFDINFTSLSKNIKMGLNIMDMSRNLGMYDSEAFFLKKLKDRYWSRSIERVVDRPRYLLGKNFSDDHILEIADRMSDAKRSKLAYYLIRNSNEQYDRVLSEINKRYNKNYPDAEVAALNEYITNKIKKIYGSAQ
jgi:hypothetical protein